VTTVFGEKTATHYEAWYETPQGRQADQQEKQLLRWLMGLFPGVRTVLEIGCGTGHFTRWLRDEGFQAVGLDISAPMLAQAQALDSPPLVRGDVHRLPFADGAVDLAVGYQLYCSSGWPSFQASMRWPFRERVSLADGPVALSTVFYLQRREPRSLQEVD
jgi:SAM-dependent methyltransferase